MAFDALRQYKAKRNFAVTSEPAEGGQASAGALSFVIQKHWARRLHYDFRLQLNGTMKSWAVPKGPSLDTKVKRMAVQVEDHPIDYSEFEGTIPANQYGAGKVIIWDSAETEKLPGIRQLDPALYISHPPLLEVATKQGVLSAAQWNVVEFHTMNTGTKSLQRPDRMIFDLDPGEGVAWDRVREAARLLHAFLKELGLPAFLKTSGGKGLHVVVPLRATQDWDAVKGFSKAVVKHLARTIPQRFVAKSGPKNRIGKIFIDYLRNGVGATTACGWSARARPGLGISVPVAWEELASLKGGITGPSAPRTRAWTRATAPGTATPVPPAA